jgi:hypothetical protein
MVGTGKQTGDEKMENIKIIADSIRKDMVRGEAKRSILAYHRRAVKAAGLVMDIEAIYLAVEEGSL